jgi:hypothetical protein
MAGYSEHSNESFGSIEGRISWLAEQLSASQEASMFRAASYPDLT